MNQQRESKRQRYAQYERYLSWALIGDAVAFGLFLLFAGLGITWAKVVLAVLAGLASLVCLASLYLTGEVLRRRSRYLVLGFCAILVCMIVSLICRYPSPTRAVGDVSAAVAGLLPLL